MSPSQLWLWRRWHTRKGSDSAKEAFRRGTHQLTCRTVHFLVCRLEYESVRPEPMGIGWQTDYPYAEINLTTRLSELTKTRVSRDGEGHPNHFVVRLTDDALFNCPLTVASDVGSLGFRPEEIGRLRTYLLKGGFLWGR